MTLAVYGVGGGKAPLGGESSAITWEEYESLIAEAKDGKFALGRC